MDVCDAITSMIWGHRSGRKGIFVVIASELSSGLAPYFSSKKANSIKLGQVEDSLPFCDPELRLIGRERYKCLIAAESSKGPWPRSHRILDASWH